MNSSSNLKSPKELFEEKRLQALAELEYQKIKEVNDIVSKKVLPPKFFFNETTIKDLFPKEEIVDEIDEEIVVDPQQEQISLLQSRLEELQNSIPEEVNLDEVFVLIENLKSRIDSLPKPKDYSKDLQEVLPDLEKQERDRRNKYLQVYVDVMNAVRWQSLSQQQKDDFVSYRQALLDIPQQPGFPENINWPTPPEI